MKMIIKDQVPPGANPTASSFLADASGLSRTKVKRAMIKGAAWLRKAGRRPMRRIRRATLTVGPGDLLALYYDDQILARSVAGAICIFDNGSYSIWDKPPGMLTQGTLFGDHCSLVRFLETRALPGRKVFLVHRLDREASGLILVAHDKKAAAAFCSAFADGAIEKTYHVTVAGNVEADLGPDGTIEYPLDGKPSRTRFKVLEYDDRQDRSRLLIHLLTGRRHQIRRHFLQAGHPVIGDPRYGRGNKAVSMRLRATGLKFACPLEGSRLSFQHPQLPVYPSWDRQPIAR